MAREQAVVAGGGGFIGGWLARSLLDQGHHVRCVDIKPLDQWHQPHAACENICLDLKDLRNCRRAYEGADRIYQLATDMGGLGFIENNKCLCMMGVLINAHSLMVAQEIGVGRFFFASTAAVYNAEKQRDPSLPGLREQDAYPAMPEDGHGWEKLFSERLCRHFREDFGLPTRVARFHNVYGPHGRWDGGRERAPAAICRKVIQAKLSGRHEIEVWGDGTQSRTFTYVEDAIKGINLITDSIHVMDPINVGSPELVTINQLVDIVEEIAGIRVERIYKPDAPTGVAGRNSDNTLIRKLLNWEPDTRLRDGMERTYRWVYDQMTSRVGLAARAG